MNQINNRGDLLSRANLEIEYKAKLLTIGAFSQTQIQARISENRLPITREISAQIDHVWNESAKAHWFPGPLARVDDYSLLPEGVLQIKLGKTDFKEYVGLRSISSLRRYGVRCISNPLSVSSVIVTNDGNLVISRRNYGDAIGSIDAIGGYVDPTIDAYKGSDEIDIFGAAKREIFEELSIAEHEVSEMFLLGLVYEYANLCHFVAPFLVKTSLSSGEIVQRKSDEINALVVDPNSFSYGGNVPPVMRLLKESYPNVEPDGRVSIALARKWLMGVRYGKYLVRSMDQI